MNQSVKWKKRATNDWVLVEPSGFIWADVQISKRRGSKYIATVTPLDRGSSWACLGTVAAAKRWAVRWLRQYSWYFDSFEILR